MGSIAESLSVVENFHDVFTNLIGLMPISLPVHMIGMADVSRAPKMGASERRERAHKIASAFGKGGWLKGYIRGKLLADPVFDVALEAVQKHGGDVTDLGCGLGLFGLWLKSDGSPALYQGCDLGGWKINEGRAAARRLGYNGVILQEVDMSEFPLERAGVICAFDVLHYLPRESQERLVRRLAQATRAGSLVLIRNGMRGCGWRSAVTLLEEWWTRGSGWIRGGEINFPRLESLVALFEREGCSVEARPLWGKTPFSSYLLRVVSRH
jgi:SAM-dependent methyltransferase